MYAGASTLFELRSSWIRLSRNSFHSIINTHASVSSMCMWVLGVLACTTRTFVCTSFMHVCFNGWRVLTKAGQSWNTFPTGLLILSLHCFCVNWSSPHSTQSPQSPASIVSCHISTWGAKNQLLPETCMPVGYPSSLLSPMSVASLSVWVCVVIQVLQCIRDLTRKWTR